MTTIVAPNRVTSSSSSSTSLLSQQQQQHHNNQNNEVDDDVRKKDENNDDNNNEYNQNNNNNNNNNFKNSFFDDWKKGNWCWERDYDKYPVVLFSNNNNNDNVDGTTIKVEKKNDEDNINDNNDNVDKDDDAYSINDRTRRDDIKNASNPGITGKGDNDNDDNDDDDINDDDSFYDDWVEGNWCLLDNYKNYNNNNNNKNSNDDSDTSRGTTCTQNNNNNNNESSKRKRKRSSDDDDKEDEDIYEEEEEEEEYYDEENEDGNDDDDDDDDDDGEFLPDDYNDVRNHQKDERSAIKDSKRGTYNGKYHNQIWMEMFRKLVEYKKLHKNTQVPRHSKEVPKLGWWASYQRKAYKEDKLLPRRLALLNSIGFVWEVHTTVTYQALWMNMFEKLIEYKNQHTNTMVPKGYDKDPKLGHWVILQRCYYKKDKLLPKRLALLNSIDFVWKGQTAVTYHELWMKMFRKLVAYKKLCKDTMVPYHYMEDPKLGQWACHQRQAYKKDKLLPQRLAFLNSIDFIWNRSKVAR